MGITYESNCNGCPECVHCLTGSGTHPVFYCDDCGAELSPEELFDYDGDDLCAECIAIKYSNIVDKYKKEGVLS